MTQTHERGFTVFELLVAISVIVVLTGLMFMFFSDSKEKSADTGIRSNLKSAISQAEVYYINQTRTYDGLCTDVKLGIVKHVQAAQRSYGTTPLTSYSDALGSTGKVEACHDGITGFAVWVPLRGSTEKNPRGWCIDSKGTSEETTKILEPYMIECP